MTSALDVQEQGQLDLSVLDRVPDFFKKIMCFLSVFVWMGMFVIVHVNTSEDNL